MPSAWLSQFRAWAKDSRRQYLLIGGSGVALLLGLYLTLTELCGRTPSAPPYIPRPLPSPVEQALGWVQTKNLKPGIHAGLALPTEHRAAACDGRANVVVFPDRRVVMLVKTRVNQQGGYDGFVIANKPILESEIQRVPTVGDYLAIKELGSSSMYPRIVYQTNDCFFDVTGGGK